jgi:hypothetical protein
VVSHKLANLLLPHLSTERLIQAIGNIEHRDRLTWLRRETLAEVDRCLANPVAIEAFEHALAGAVMTTVLQREHAARARQPESQWIDDFFSRHWLVAMTAALKSEVAARRRSIAQHRVSPVRIDHLVQALLGDRRASGAELPRGLIVTRDADQRTHRVVRRLLARFSADHVPLTWLRVTGRGDALRTTASDHLITADVPLDALRDDGADPDLNLENVSRLAAEGDRFAMLMRARIPELAPAWMAGRRAGRGLAEAGRLAFLLFFGEKYPFARGLNFEARRAGVPTFAYFPSIELGAPSIYRYSADHLFVANAWTRRLLIELGFDAARVSAVGSTEVDEVLNVVEPEPELPQRAFRVLFLTKWPDCAVDNRPILAATIAAFESSGRPFHIVVRRHPKDRRSYRRYESPGVTITARAYERQLRWCNLVVTGMSNTVFHALALGLPTLVVNTNPKLELGQEQLFALPDLPASVRRADSLEGVARVLEALMESGLQTYCLPKPLVLDLFHALDGGTADRMAAKIVGTSMAAAQDVLRTGATGRG